jgi:hypothetical protein
MTDPEREHLLQENRDLERSRDRWRLTALVLAGILILPVVLGGLLGLAWLPRMEIERARAAEMERVARDAELRARQQAEEAARQRDAAEKARRAAEKRLKEEKH